MADATFEKAMKLAVVTGLRSMLGPALVARSSNRPEQQEPGAGGARRDGRGQAPARPQPRHAPAAARPRAGRRLGGPDLAGRGGDGQPLDVPLGAAVAMGVAVAAPKIRRTLT